MPLLDNKDCRLNSFDIWNLMYIELNYSNKADNVYLTCYSKMPFFNIKT